MMIIIIINRFTINTLHSLRGFTVQQGTLILKVNLQMTRQVMYI